MKYRIETLLLAAALAGLAPAPAALAQDAAQVQNLSNQIEGLEVAEQGGAIYLRLTMKEPLASPPPSFSVANPARIKEIQRLCKEDRAKVGDELCMRAAAAAERRFFGDRPEQKKTP